MAGAFQTSREIFSNAIWQDIPKFRIFFFIVGNAVFSEEGTIVAGTHLKRGQFLRSYRNLSDDLQFIENRKIKKYSISVISRKVEQLVKENRLKIEESELGTLFTVVNYALYQDLSNYRKVSGNSVGTGMEQGWNNNKNVKEGKEGLKDVVDSASENDPQNLVADSDHILDYYMAKRGKPGKAPKVSDYDHVKPVLSAGVSVAEALLGIDKAFNEFTPTYSDDEISSFAYCKKVILSDHYRRKAKKEASQHASHPKHSQQHNRDEYAELSL
jgi:hypothetical protein